MRYFVVGTFFMLILMLSFYLTILEKSDTKNKYPYKLSLYLPKADGLKEGDDVFLRGILFGQIFEIKKVSYYEIKNPKFDLTLDQSAVELVLIVKAPITLWENYKVRFKTKTLFSSRHIDLDPGFPEQEPILQAYPSVNTPSSDYIDDLFTLAYDVLKENRSDLRRMIINLNSISFKLKGNKGTIPRLINEEELYDSTEHFVYDIGIAAKEARRYIENQRETDIHPITFTMVIFFNLMGLSILSTR
jgi:ABC-type transporter Mla subunit MlaD